jgi:hypothetical protein
VSSCLSLLVSVHPRLSLQHSVLVNELLMRRLKRYLFLNYNGRGCILICAQSRASKTKGNHANSHLIEAGSIAQREICQYKYKHALITSFFLTASTEVLHTLCPRITECAIHTLDFFVISQICSCLINCDDRARISL